MHHNYVKHEVTASDSTVVYSIRYNTVVGSNNDPCGVEIQHSHS